MKGRRKYELMLENGENELPKRSRLTNYGVHIWVRFDVYDEIVRMSNEKGISMGELVRQALFTKYPKLKELNK